jgi:hypothetical protein
VPVAEQLDGADLASRGKSSLSDYRRAGRAAHLEAVRPPINAAAYVYAEQATNSPNEC